MNSICSWFFSQYFGNALKFMCMVMDSSGDVSPFLVKNIQGTFGVTWEYISLCCSRGYLVDLQSLNFCLLHRIPAGKLISCRLTGSAADLRSRLMISLCFYNTSPCLVNKRALMLVSYTSHQVFHLLASPANTASSQGKHTNSCWCYAKHCYTHLENRKVCYLSGPRWII